MLSRKTAFAMILLALGTTVAALVASTSCQSEKPQEYVFDWPVPTDVPVDFRWVKFGKVTEGRYHMVLEPEGEGLRLSYRELTLKTYSDRPFDELPESERAAVTQVLQGQLPSLRLSKEGRVQEVIGVREAAQAMVEQARAAGVTGEELAALEARLTDPREIEVLEWRAKEHWRRLVEDFIDIGLSETDLLLRDRPVPAEGEDVLAQDHLTHQGADAEYPGCVRFKILRRLAQEQAKRLALEKARAALIQEGVPGAANATFLANAEIFNIRSESITSIRLDSLRPYRYYSEVTTSIQARHEAPVELSESYDYVFHWPSN